MTVFLWGATLAEVRDFGRIERASRRSFTPCKTEALDVWPLGDVEVMMDQQLHCKDRSCSVRPVNV